MKNIIKLTQKLISLPSWVNDKNNEIKIGNYIFEYLKNYSNLSVKKQIVKDGRFNIIATNSDTIDLLLIGHIDTVGVDKSWDTDPTNPIIKDGRLYGRGATDMKSGLAAMMLFACQKELPKNTGFLFYIDEEYSFLGMNKFIADYGAKIKPKTIISLDGSELEIGNGCRGLIEIELEILGKSCHAATPENGISAIDAGYNIYQSLKKELISCTVNLGLIFGGSAPNLVAGSCQLTLDIRPRDNSVNGQNVISKIKQFAKSENVSIANLKINYDFGSWLTPANQLEKFGLPFKNIRDSGYIDIQLLWQKFNKPICLTIGAGTQSKAHAPNEFVEIKMLEKLPRILLDIINNVKIKL